MTVHRLLLSAAGRARVVGSFASYGNLAHVLCPIQKSPRGYLALAIEAVRRIDELFAIEREINGADAAVRLALRQDRSRPLVAALEIWLRTESAKLSSKNPIAKAIQYSPQTLGRDDPLPRRR